MAPISAGLSGGGGRNRCGPFLCVHKISSKRIAQRSRRVVRQSIFGITFQNADTTQIAQLAEATRGAVFDGTKSLTEAFRTVRGYN